MGSPNIACLMPSSNAISPCRKNLTLPSPVVVVGLSGGVIYHQDYCPLASLNITVFYRINQGFRMTFSYVEDSYCPWGALTLTSFLFQHRWSCRTKNLVHWVTASLVAQTVKNLPAMWEIWVWSLGWEDPLEEGMATHSSTLARRIPWTEVPGRLQSLASQRVGHDWAIKHTSVHWVTGWILYWCLMDL